MCQSALSFLILKIFDVANLPMPEIQNIESQDGYFFAEPKLIKEVIVGMLDAGMLSMLPIVDLACYFEDEEHQVETSAKKAKIAAKPLLDGRAYFQYSAMRRYETRHALAAAQGYHHPLYLMDCPPIRWRD